MTEIKTQVREIADVQRVRLRSQYANELFIDQSEDESLTIEATPRVLERIETTVDGGLLSIDLAGGIGDRIRDALTTSLTRPHVVIRLSLRQLRGLDIAALAYIRVRRFETDTLDLLFNGPGEIEFDHLQADTLSVTNSGPGMIRLAGQVSQQDVSLRGPGEFAARDMLSKQTRISVNGIGNATIWAEEQLDVTISGIGGVLYMGSPVVRSKISPMGSLARLGDR